MSRLPRLPYHSLLQCHPATPEALVNRLEVSVLAAAPPRWHWRYQLTAPLTQLHIARPAIGAQRQDLLWQHSCFEAFVGVVGESAYREFNFAPSGDWACYDFADYRQAAKLASPEISTPQLYCQVSAQQVQLDVVLDATALPVHAPEQVLQWGFSAVIEAQNGRKSYWALTHPAAQADFHLRTGFSAQL